VKECRRRTALALPGCGAAVRSRADSSVWGDVLEGPHGAGRLPRPQTLQALKLDVVQAVDTVEFNLLTQRVLALGRGGGVVGVELLLQGRRLLAALGRAFLFLQRAPLTLELAQARFGQVHGQPHGVQR
jgi:hypothetical protein